MYWMKQSRQENLVYLVVWGLLFATPLLSLYVRTISDSDATFNWTEVFLVWRRFAVYLVLFLIHNFLLAPLLVHQRRRVVYVAVVVLVIAAFMVYQYNSRPAFRPMGFKPPMEQADRHQQPHFNEPSRTFDDERLPFDGPLPQNRQMRQMRHHDGPPPIVGERDILAIIVLILMFGANLGIKSYFRSRDDRKRLEKLERENLAQQLEYLRYQINPHFFMNTLNNIHALVDIDPDKAKSTIIELSRLMRYVLYDSSRPSVLLSKEIDFLKQYIALMRLRYTDRVAIEVSMPEDVPGVEVPPLLFISFIENAFKHGVSYEQHSFVRIGMQLQDGYLNFTCENSQQPKDKRGGAKDPHSGIGLENVRKRLKLIYGNNYFFLTNDKEDKYEVSLKIPVNDDTMLSHR
jgi:hypothetical protein